MNWLKLRAILPFTPTSADHSDTLRLAVTRISWRWRKCLIGVLRSSHKKAIWGRTMYFQLYRLNLTRCGADVETFSYRHRKEIPWFAWEATQYWVYAHHHVTTQPQSNWFSERITETHLDDGPALLKYSNLKEAFRSEAALPSNKIIITLQVPYCVWRHRTRF